MIKLLLILLTLTSCATQNSSKQYSSSEPDFGLRLFSYPLYPDKQYIVFKEHNDAVIANKILSSYSTDDLINALSIAYVQLYCTPFVNTDLSWI